MADPDLYAGREQTLVKHSILGKYLERFAHIIGSHWNSITYVDCFSGPWNVKSDDMSDSSFSIALQELRKARDTHLARGRSIALRCFFIERELGPYRRLKQFADSVTDAEIETRNSLFEESIPQILKFVRKGGRDSFPFFFVDPTGWTGFPMDVIAPLLRLDQVEVLINFMTKDIRRFIESPQQQTQQGFARLFGSATFKDRLETLQGLDREDAAVSEYRARVIETGRFDFTASAIILHPLFDRTNFHLIYATRHALGVEVFKEAEKSAMGVMEQARSEAQKRTREKRTGQGELFGSEVLHDPTYYESLRERYLSKAKKSVLQLLRAKRQVPYDEAWTAALAQPLAWESDLKSWINDWRKQGLLHVEGLTGKQTVPKREKGHTLVWLRA